MARSRSRALRGDGDRATHRGSAAFPHALWPGIDFPVVWAFFLVFFLPCRTPRSGVFQRRLHVPGWRREPVESSCPVPAPSAAVCQDLALPLDLRDLPPTNQIPATTGAFVLAPLRKGPA